MKPATTRPSTKTTAAASPTATTKIPLRKDVVRPSSSSNTTSSTTNPRKPTTPATSSKMRSFDASFKNLQQRLSTPTALNNENSKNNTDKITSPASNNNNNNTVTSSEGKALMDRISNFDLFASVKAKQEINSAKAVANSRVATTTTTAGFVVDSGCGDGKINNSPVSVAKNKNQQQEDEAYYDQMAENQGSETFMTSTKNSSSNEKSKTKGPAVTCCVGGDDELPEEAKYGEPPSDERGSVVVVAAPPPTSANKTVSEKNDSERRTLRLKNSELFVHQLEVAADAVQHFVYFDKLISLAESMLNKGDDDF